jgi:hypothetical protein
VAARPGYEYPPGGAPEPALVVPLSARLPQQMRHRRKSVVMFGSHKRSNEGVKTNRDASLIVDDKEIAEYLAEVYDYDWTRLATAHLQKARPRVAKSGEKTPEGFTLVAFSEVFDD